jgi:glutamate/aspartate transport system substrate-binding protein
MLIDMGTVSLTNAEPLYGTLKKIKDTGTIRVGHREASIPFSYLNRHGAPIGYTMDLCYNIIDRIKEELDLPELKVKLVPVTVETIIPLLVNGTIDIECGSTTNNLSRAKHIDYLHITFISGTKLAVKKGSGIKEIEDLDGKRIALSIGSTNAKAVQQIAKEKGLTLDYHMVNDHPQAWQALETNRVDAYASDDVLLSGLIAKSNNPELYEIVGRFLSYDPYGIPIRRDDSAMRLLGNTVLSDMMRSGEIFKLYDQWFLLGPTNINLPLSDGCDRSIPKI